MSVLLSSNLDKENLDVTKRKVNTCPIYRRLRDGVDQPKARHGRPYECDETATSRNQIERDQRHQVEQKYPDLVNRKTCVMHGIEGLNRELKPTGMQPVHPVMRKDKDAEPDA